MSELVDLHVHSNASDGTCSPEEVVHLALDAHLYSIALTDHDTVAGIEKAQQAALHTSLEVIPGIELSCSYHDRDIHILGLFLDFQNPILQRELELIQEIRNQRNREMIRRFAFDGILITEESLYQGNPNMIITRAHFANALLSLGIVKNRDSAFRQYLNPGSRYYIPKQDLTPQKAMELLRKSHAFPVLAHPLQYKLDRPDLLHLIQELKDLGLMGLECFHSSNNSYESSVLCGIARQYHLLPTGGSDFHGDNKPDIYIGRGRGGLRVSKPLLDDIKHQYQLTFPEYSKR